MIVDSPGVGESDIMDEIVTQYLPQAFAFLYVINSANAGGVQRDRVSIAKTIFQCQFKEHIVLEVTRKENLQPVILQRTTLPKCQ